MDQVVFKKIIENLENDLSGITYECIEFHEHTEKAIGLCMIAIQQVKNYVTENGFKNTDDEIDFFKNTKPRLFRNLVFYKWLERIESFRPKYNQEKQIEYLKKNIDKIYEFYDEIKDFMEYYNSGRTHLDNLYFTRYQTEIVLNNRSSNYLIYPEFCTIHDDTVAKILAYQQLENYLGNEIRKLTEPKAKIKVGTDSEITGPKEKWTSNQVDYVEMLYAVKELGAINNGQTTVQKLHQLFSKILIVPDIDIYEKYQDIKSRKKNKTVFIDKLRDTLRSKIDKSDEFNPE
jgi:hypothetical protein